MIGPLRPSDKLDIERVNTSRELAIMQVRDVGRFCTGVLASLTPLVRFSSAESFDDFRSTQALIFGGEHLENIVAERPIASALAIGGLYLASRARESILLVEKRYQEIKNFPEGEVL